MNINTKAIGFGWLKKFGKTVLHTVVMALCIGLSGLAIFGAQNLSMSNFHFAFKIILYPIYYYLVVNYIAAYAQAVFCDPGRPPQNPEDNLTPRCQKCNLLKPERTHHCSVCGLCCMKYDHHCPWIANCVGLNNYGYFLKFLGFGMAATSLSLLLEIMALITGTFAVDYSKVAKVMSCVFVLTFTGCSIMCTAMMLFSHFPYIQHNQTTVESYDNDFDRRQAQKQGLKFEYPFDKGLLKNLQEIFGVNYVKTILVPAAKIVSTEDGMSYISNKNNKL